MKSQTSLVATQVRLQEWALQVKECQNRPVGMDVSTWCVQNNITKANYYYRLRRVREACLAMTGLETPTSFVELEEPVLTDVMVPKCTTVKTVASLILKNGIRIELHSDAPEQFLTNLLEAVSHAE